MVVIVSVRASAFMRACEVMSVHACVRDACVRACLT